MINVDWPNSSNLVKKAVPLTEATVVGVATEKEPVLGFIFVNTLPLSNSIFLSKIFSFFVAVI